MRAGLIFTVSAIALVGCVKSGADHPSRGVSMCETMESCAKRCMTADGAACTSAGALFVARGPSEANYSAAKEAYDKACNLGHAEGCMRAARFAIERNVITRLYRRACKLGDRRGCRAKPPATPSVRRLTRACLWGSRAACKLRGRMVADNQIQTISNAQRIAFLRAGCRTLEPKSCGALGRMYHDGDGVPRDVQRAYDAFHRACDEGGTDSCRALTKLYETQADAGNAITKTNPGHTVQAYRGACHTGDTVACLRFAQALQIGDGTARDRVKAVRIFESCCASGDSRGCVAAAKMYRRGWGVEFSPSRAANLLRSGCKLGDATSCRELAVLYERGRGVARDTRKASDLLVRACTMGSTLACDRKRRLDQRQRRHKAMDTATPTRQAMPTSAE